MSPKKPSTTSVQFNFDRQLWNRFIAISQPYFYPLGKHHTKIYIGLLFLLLATVIAVAFWTISGLILGGQFLLPDFFETLAGAVVEQIEGLLQSWVPYVAASVLAVTGMVAFSLRRFLLERWVQWSLLGLLLFLSLATNALIVLFSYVTRFTNNALAQKDVDTFWQFTFIFIAIIVVGVPVLVLYKYIQLKLALRWRRWLTDYFFDRYFSDRAYYELDANAADPEIDNPDQRIAQDIKSFTEVTLSFLLDVLDSFITLFSFALILYNISKLLTVALIIYVTAGTLIAAISGRKLIKINYDQLRLEADFRYGMVHVRDNAESIAFYQGERLERQQVTARLMDAIRNFNLLIIWQSLIGLFQNGYSYFTFVIPSVVIAPLYFAGETDFGAFSQATIAFTQVLRALSIVANRIDEIAAFAASINRLGIFYERLADPAALKQRYDQTIQTEIAPHLQFSQVTLMTPNAEQTLVRDLSLQVGSGDRLLIVGASGCGKSSLLRAIAGLWNTGDGQIHRPGVDDMLFLPQKPYMLLGTLREQLAYPKNYNCPDETLSDILTKVNLGDLPERFDGFDTIHDWPSLLSLGQQQRLAFARILLTQPRYVMLDEATSALDIPNERHLYGLLDQMEAVYVSVGHRPTLLNYHQKVLELSTDSTWKVRNTVEYQKAST
ncbi:MAG: ABC transporter ATP-binding protein/permease [Cyanobacteria bacterium P01_H01_bin.58]